MKKGFLNLFKQKEEVSSEEEITTEEEVVKETNNQRKPLEPVTEEMVTYCKEALEKILKDCGFEATVIAETEEETAIKITVDESVDIGRIIGKEGATIDAFQTLIKSMGIKKFDRSFQLFIDAGDYKKKRIENAKATALRAARYLDPLRPKKELPPMNASERRAIHMLFKSNPDIDSYSVGQGYNRRIIIEKKKKKSLLDG